MEKLVSVVQVCAHACQPEKTAMEVQGGGVWTRAVLRSMERDDSDLFRMLKRAAKDDRLREMGQAQY